MRFETKAIVCALRNHGEHGGVVRLMTPDHGLQAAYVRGARGRRMRPVLMAGNQVEANRLQVAMELQAVCFAGVWANHANQAARVLEPGDVDEGLGAAAAIGDDRLQRNAGRAVTPDSFTHGSSADRQRWLSTGLRSGDPSACDTFN